MKILGTSMPRLPKIRRGILILSKQRPEDIKPTKKDILYKGFLVKANVRELFSYRIGVARFPVLVQPKYRGFKGVIARLTRKKTKPFLASEELPIAFSANLPNNEKNNLLRFGSQADFWRALNELKISSTNADFKRIASKYDFPENFLKQAYSKMQRYRRADIQAKQKAKFLEPIGRLFEKRSQKIDFKNIDIEIDEIGMACFDLFNSNDKRWRPIFRFWNQRSSTYSRRLIGVFKRLRVRVILLTTLISVFTFSVWAMILFHFDWIPILISLGLVSILAVIIGLAKQLWGALK